MQAQDRTSNEWKIEETVVPAGRLPTGTPRDRGGFNLCPHMAIEMTFRKYHCPSIMGGGTNAKGKYDKICGINNNNIFIIIFNNSIIFINNNSINGTNASMRHNNPNTLK